MTRPWLHALAVALPGLFWPPAAAPGQELPATVDPGIQGRRLLPPRPPMPLLGPIVPRDLDCGSDSIGAETRFTLRGIHIESDLSVRDADPAARWRPYLGEEVSLAQVCAIARAVAGDYARESGRGLRALLPAQHIAAGLVHIRIAEPGAPSPDK